MLILSEMLHKSLQNVLQMSGSGNHVSGRP